MEAIKVADGVWRGDQPKDPSDFIALKQLGITCILDLETGLPLDGDPDDEVNAASILGIRTIRNPLGGLCPPSKADLNRCIGVIEMFQPVYVHCLAGVDRTGMVIAWYRMKNGWSRAAAVAEMKYMGMHWWYYWWIWSL